MTNERKLELLGELTSFAASGEFNVESYTQLLFKHINEGFVTSHQFLIDFLVEMAITLKSYDLLLLAVNSAEIVEQYKLSELSYDDYRTLASLKIKAHAYYARYCDMSKRSEVEKMIYCYQDSFGDGEVYQYQAILDIALDDEEVNPFNQSMVESYLIKYFIYGNSASDDQLRQIGVNKADVEMKLDELFEMTKEQYRLSFIDKESSAIYLKMAKSLSLIILNKCFKLDKYKVVEYEKLAIRVLFEYNAMRKLSAEAYLDAKYQFDIKAKQERMPNGQYFKPNELKQIKKKVENKEIDKDLEVKDLNDVNVTPKNKFNLLSYLPLDIIISSVVVLVILLFLTLAKNTDNPIIAPIYKDCLISTLYTAPFIFGAYRNSYLKKWPQLLISLGMSVLLVVIISSITMYNYGFPFDYLLNNIFSFTNFIIPMVIAFVSGFFLPKWVKNKYLVFVITLVLVFIVRLLSINIFMPR